MMISEKDERVADELDTTILGCDQEGEVKSCDEEGPRSVPGEEVEMRTDREQRNDWNKRSMDVDGKVVESVSVSCGARSTSHEHCMDKGGVAEFVRRESELSSSTKSSDEEHGKDQKRRRCRVELKGEDDKEEGCGEKSKKRLRRDPRKLERTLEKWKRNGSGERPPRYPGRGLMRVSGISVQQYLRIIGVERRR